MPVPGGSDLSFAGHSANGCLQNRRVNYQFRGEGSKKSWVQERLSFWAFWDVTYTLWLIPLPQADRKVITPWPSTLRITCGFKCPDAED